MTAGTVLPPRPVGADLSALSSAASAASAAEHEPVLIGMPTDRELTDKLLSPAFQGFSAFRPLMAMAAPAAGLLIAALTYTVITGIGVWGNNIPVAWALGIVNFVWWIGIGHAGTFISAILLLLGAKWRTSINRFSEGMTLIAVINAGLFPLLHTGRPWFAYWLVPYPSTMGVWPQFRSALPWDAAAVATYFTVSLLFWFLGLVPDLAAARDAAPEPWRRRLYGVFALGWRGSARAWARYRVAYGLLAGLATPLVVSVHSIVSLDFAITILPGWHSSIFPPYFVAGAIHSGFAMLVTLLLPARRLFKLESVITRAHLDAMAKTMLITGWIVTYSYAAEAFSAWYSDDPHEIYTLLVNRPFGPYAWLYWTMLTFNCLVPQLFWSRRARQSPVVLFIAGLLINTGMWIERFVLIVTSEARDFLASSWGSYRPSLTDAAIFFGTLGLFSLLFLIFLRVVPFIPLSELKTLRDELLAEGSEGGR